MLTLDSQILEMITMTSGLTFDLEAYMDLANKAINDPNPDPIRESRAFENVGGGGSLVDALDISFMPMVEENRGSYDYLVMNNILSYVILKVSGLTPRQYLAENILPALGIENDDLFWGHMSNGVENAFAQINLTAGQMAKFGQLYLQRGATGSGNQLVSEDWIDDSLSVFVEGTLHILGQIKGGYLWFDFSDRFSPGTPGTWCAWGTGDQYICVNSLLDRVVVTQREGELASPASQGVVEIGMSSNFFVGNATSKKKNGKGKKGRGGKGKKKGGKGKKDDSIVSSKNDDRQSKLFD